MLQTLGVRCNLKVYLAFKDQILQDLWLAHVLLDKNTKVSFRISSVINSTAQSTWDLASSFNVLLIWLQRVNVYIVHVLVYSQSGLCLQGWGVWTLEISGSRIMPGCWLLMYVPFKVMVTSLNHRKGRILRRCLTLKACLFQHSWTCPWKHCISLYQIPQVHQI